MRICLAVACVWVIIFIIPFVVYGSASSFISIKPPEGTLWRFLLSVGVTKLGTAIGFVLLFVLCQDVLRDRRLVYAGIWFAMFAISEAGDVVKTGYTITEALLGIVSEALYTPLSALTVDRLLRRASVQP